MSIGKVMNKTMFLKNNLHSLKYIPVQPNVPNIHPLLEFCFITCGISCIKINTVGAESSFLQAVVTTRTSAQWFLSHFSSISS